MSENLIRLPEEVKNLSYEEVIQSYTDIYASYNSKEEALKKAYQECGVLADRCRRLEGLLAETKEIIPKLITFINGYVKALFPKKSEASKNVNKNGDSTVDTIVKNARELARRIADALKPSGKKHDDNGPAPAPKKKGDQGQKQDQQQAQQQDQQQDQQQAQQQGQQKGTEKPKRSMGSSNNGSRRNGFILKYPKNFDGVYVTLNGYTCTLSEALETLGINDPKKIKVKPGDTDCYMTMAYFPAICVPHLHVSSRVRAGDEALRAEHNRIINVSAADSSFLAHIITEYLNLSVPLARQERYEWPGLGINLKDNTVSGWLDYLCDKLGLKYLFFYMLDCIKSRTVKIGDETFIVCKEKAGMSYYWVIRTSPYDKEAVEMVCFTFSTSHSALVPQLYFDGMEGYFLTDGNETYPAFVKHCEGLILANCWHHSRRPLKNLLPSRAKIMEMEEKGVKEDDLPWSWRVYTSIGKMFEEEQKLKDLSSEERLKQRNGEMKRLADDVIRILTGVKEESLDYQVDPAVRNAVDYILDREKYLYRIFENGDIPLSTNDVEQDNMLIALFRNNSKAFEKSRRAFQLGVLASLVASVRSHGTDVELFLNYLIEKAPYILSDRTELDKFDVYWEKKLELYNQAMEKKTAAPGINLSVLEGMKPDLSHLAVLLDDSEEFKAYKEKYEQDANARRHYFCRMASLLKFRESPLSKELTIKVLDALMNTGKLPPEFCKALEFFKEDLGNDGVLLEKGYLDQEKYASSETVGIIFPDHNLYWSTVELLERREQELARKAGAAGAADDAEGPAGQAPDDTAAERPAGQAPDDTTAERPAGQASDDTAAERPVKQAPDDTTAERPAEQAPDDTGTKKADIASDDGLEDSNEKTVIPLYGKDGSMCVIFQSGLPANADIPPIPVPDFKEGLGGSNDRMDGAVMDPGQASSEGNVHQEAATGTQSAKEVSRNGP